MLECAVALFACYKGILDYCDSRNWRAVWALVGSGRATGEIISLSNHEAALAKVQAAIPSLGKSGGPDLAPATAPAAAPMPLAKRAPRAVPAPKPLRGADAGASKSPSLTREFCLIEANPEA